jgi:hypothetical protein
MVLSIGSIGKKTDGLTRRFFIWTFHHLTFSTFLLTLILNKNFMEESPGIITFNPEKIQR